MAKLSELETLRSTVDRLQKEAHKAAGALEQATLQLKKEFGCDTVEAGEKLLRTLKKEEQEAQEEFDKALAAFEKEYGEELDT